MKISTRSLALMALAVSTALPPEVEACAPPPKREECKKVRPTRADAWLAVLIREGYLNPDGSPRAVAKPLPRPFEEDHMQAPPQPPTPREPKECRACGRG